MRARALGTRDAPLVRTLLAANPVANVFVSSRIDAGLLWPGSPATLYGWPGDAPRHLLHAGSNLVPVFALGEPDERDAAIAAFVEALGPHRWCQSIVGSSAGALALHRALAIHSRSYAGQREIRARQPLMVTREGRRYVIANNIETPRMLAEEVQEAYFEPLSFTWQAEKADGGTVALNAESDRYTSNTWASLSIGSRVFDQTAGAQKVFVSDFAVLDTGSRIAETYNCVRSEPEVDAVFANGFE